MDYSALGTSAAPKASAPPKPTYYLLCNVKTGKFSKGKLSAMKSAGWSHFAEGRHKTWGNISDLKRHLRMLMDWHFAIPDHWMVVEVGEATKQYKANELVIPERRP